MNIDFQKYADGLVPAVIQDSATSKVLMLGFMNADALRLTSETRRVTFFSRSRQTLWVKGETSGNFIQVESIRADCDSDTLLIKAKPMGPTCHTGLDTCFSEVNRSDHALFALEAVIRDRHAFPYEGSYTSELFAAGIGRIAQKVGEEAIEVVIEAMNNPGDEQQLIGESADLLYHLLVLLAAKNVRLEQVFDALSARVKKPNSESS